MPPHAMVESVDKNQSVLGVLFPKAFNGNLAVRWLDHSRLDFEGTCKGVEESSRKWRNLANIADDLKKNIAFFSRCHFTLKGVAATQVHTLDPAGTNHIISSSVQFSSFLWKVLLITRPGQESALRSLSMPLSLTNLVLPCFELTTCVELYFSNLKGSRGY